MDLPFTARVPVRFRDMDAMGHVNHAVYLSYMEFGRQEYFCSMSGLRDVKAFNFIVGSVECRYLSPATLGETVLVRLGVTRFGNASFTMHYRLSEETTGRPVAQASTELVCYDYESRRPRRIPLEMRQQITAFEARLREAPSDLAAPLPESEPHT